MRKFKWKVLEIPGETVYRCSTEQTTVEIYPRPAYCDRGRWIAYVDCPGFPQNPNPIDIADGFPRYYFDIDRAKAEIEAFFNVRGYIPLGV